MSQNSSTSSHGIDGKNPVEPSSSSDKVLQRIADLEKELWYLRQQQNRDRKGTSSTQTPEEYITTTPEGKKGTQSPSFNAQIQDQILMLTDAMPHMVWISDSEGNCTHANDRFYEYTGYSQNEDDGWAWVHTMHPEDLKKSVELGNKAAQDNSSFSMEVRVRGADGEYRWHLMHSIPFWEPETGSTKWYGTTTCIQDQKDVLEQVKQSEIQLQTLADAIPHIVFAATPEGIIDFWNHRWIEYSGLSDSNSINSAWELLIHPQDRNTYLNEWSKALEQGDTFEFEFRLKRAVGVKSSPVNAYRWHLARAVAMRDAEGEIVRWFGTWTEIESQKSPSSNPSAKTSDQNPRQIQT